MLAINQISYTATLDARTFQEGRHWIASCPPLDVMTQAETKKRAIEQLHEAVELWFESAIQRGVLDQALEEVNFTRVGADAITEPNVVQVTEHSTPPLDKKPAKRKKLPFGEYVEVSVPAYYAAQMSAIESQGAPG